MAVIEARMPRRVIAVGRCRPRPAAHTPARGVIRRGWPHRRNQITAAPVSALGHVRRCPPAALRVSGMSVLLLYRLHNDPRDGLHLIRGKRRHRAAFGAVGDARAAVCQRHSGAVGVSAPSRPGSPARERRVVDQVLAHDLPRCFPFEQPRLAKVASSQATALPRRTPRSAQSYR